MLGRPKRCVLGQGLGSFPGQKGFCEAPLHNRSIGEWLLGRETQILEQLAVGVGFGVLGGEKFVPVEDGVRAGEKAQGLCFP